MAESSKYGPWVASDDWRSWVGVSITSETDTTATVRVRGWFESQYGSSTGSGNVKGWVGYSIGSGSVTWSGASNIDPFSAGDSFYFNSGKTWTISKTHAVQTVWGYADVEAQAGFYSGSKSECYASVSVPAKTSYKVTYNANGGSGAPSAQTKWHGETLTLSSAKPTRTGYTFAGWNTKSNGSGTNYAAGANYTGNAALALYAKWTPVTYVMTYKSGYTGGAADQTQTKTYGVNATIKAASTYSRTGYTFQSWKGSNGTTYAAGATYASNAAITLTAQWQILTYAVTYNANGGTGAPTSQTKTYGTALKLSSVVPTRSGYAFLGWATTSGGAAAYQPGGSYAANSAATLYAKWQVAAPSLSITSAYRADADGDPADDGTYASVTIDATSQTGAALSFSVTVGSVTVTSPTTSVAPTYTFLLANACPSQDDAYAVSVTVTDTNGSATRTTVIQTAWYAIDIKRGGHGIAFGKVASTDQLADFGMDVNVDGRVTADGIVKASQRFISESGTAGSLMRFVASRTDTGNLIWFGISWNGTDRGIWDDTANRWMLYINSDGENVYGGTPHKTTTNVTLSSCTATGHQCWTNGIMAGYTLRVLNLSSALASGSSRTIGTLPAGYRPIDYHYAVAYANNATFNGRLMVQINTNGAMSLFNMSGSSLGTSVNIYVSDTYTI